MVDAGFNSGGDGGVNAKPGRAAMRDAMFLQAELRRADEAAPEMPQPLRVRNLSAGGLMVETDAAYARGEAVVLTLRNIGDVAARVAWTDGRRVGLAFDRPIDPRQVRKAAPKSPGSGMQLIRPLAPQSRRPAVRSGSA